MGQDGVGASGDAGGEAQPPAADRLLMGGGPRPMLQEVEFGDEREGRFANGRLRAVHGLRSSAAEVHSGA